MVLLPAQWHGRHGGQDSVLQTSGCEAGSGPAGPRWDPETWDHLLFKEMQTPFWMSLALLQCFCPWEVSHERALLWYTSVPKCSYCVYVILGVGWMEPNTQHFH